MRNLYSLTQPVHFYSTHAPFSTSLHFHLSPRSSTVRIKRRSIIIMDSDHLDMVVRKYITPIEEIECDSICSADVHYQAAFQLSAFERLPLELRQTIYSWLGYPVGGKMWRFASRSKPLDNGGTTYIYYRVHATILNFDFWRWDATPLASGSHMGIRASFEHPELSEYDCQHQVYP